MFKKGARVTGAARTQVGTDLRREYDKGRSIRELAESNGRSYGFVHRVLSESGAALRGRGGSASSRANAAGRNKSTAVAAPN